MDRCLAVCAANVKLCALNIYRERETKKERGEDRQCKSLSAFLFPIPTFLRHYVFLLSTTRKRRTEELLRAARVKHGLVQLSARGVVCSALVCIVSTRPTSLCKPTTRRLLSLCFFFLPSCSYHNVVASADKKADGGTAEASTLSAWVDEGRGKANRSAEEDNLAIGRPIEVESKDERFPLPVNRGPWTERAISTGRPPGVGYR